MTVLEEMMENADFREFLKEIRKQTVLIFKPDELPQVEVFMAYAFKAGMNTGKRD